MSRAGGWPGSGADRHQQVSARWSADQLMDGEAWKVTPLSTGRSLRRASMLPHHTDQRTHDRVSARTHTVCVLVHTCPLPHTCPSMCPHPCAHMCAVRACTGVRVPMCTRTGVCSCAHRCVWAAQCNLGQRPGLGHLSHLDLEAVCGPDINGKQRLPL